MSEDLRPTIKEIQEVRDASQVLAEIRATEAVLNHIVTILKEKMSTGVIERMKPDLRAAIKRAFHSTVSVE